MDFLAFYVAMRIVEGLIKRFWNDNLNDYKE